MSENDGRLSGWRVALNRAKYAARKSEYPRRRFLLQGFLALAAGVFSGLFFLRENSIAAETGKLPIRPPTASLDDAAFRSQCVRCGLCGTVCENGCIRFFGFDEPEWGPMTPYIDVRRRSCTLCMRCTQICPSGALRDVKDSLDVIAEEVHMGVAEVDPDRCLSYLGRVCGVCHDACPLSGRAIRLTPPAKPVVIEEGCVGCGRCVEECPQTPYAISVSRRKAVLAIPEQHRVGGGRD